MKINCFLLLLTLITACSQPESKDAYAKSAKALLSTSSSIQHKEFSKLSTDSLKTILQHSPKDSNRVNILLTLSGVESFNSKEKDQSLNIAKDALDIAQQLNYKTGVGSSLTAIAKIFYSKQEYQKSMINYINALNVWVEIDNKKMIATTFSSIGECYFALHDSLNGLAYIEKGLGEISKTNDKKDISDYLTSAAKILAYAKKYSESNNYYDKAISGFGNFHDKKSQSELLWKIANNYMQEFNYAKSVNYLLRSLKLAEEVRDSGMILSNYWYLSINYLELKDYNKAEIFLNKQWDFNKLKGESTTPLLINFGQLNQSKGNIKVASEYYKKYLDETKKENNDFMIALSYYNMGIVSKQYDDRQALRYYLIALEKANYFKGEDLKSMIRNELIEIYTKLKNHPKIIEYSKISIEKHKEEGQIESLKSTYKSLADSYFKLHLFESAYKYGELYHVIKDSLLNDSRNKAIAEMQKQNEFNNQLKQIEIEKQQNNLKELNDRTIAKIELNNQKKVSIFIGIGLLLIIILAALIYYRYKLTNKQKCVIEIQKQIVEDKQKEILSSIRYAKRIQKSLMPSEKHINNSINRLKNKH